MTKSDQKTKTLSGPRFTDTMPASHKRQREAAKSSTASGPSVVSLRTALTLRTVADPKSSTAAWRAAAAAAGFVGADAYLCHLGLAIANALRTIPVASEAAHAQLQQTRAALLAAVNARCDELDARISSAVSAKVAALERELCAVDTALGRWRADRVAAAEAAAALGDAEFAAKHTELNTRLDSAEAQLLALPTAVVEPPLVVLTLDLPRLLDSIANVGLLVAPVAITAADLALEGIARYALPGCKLLLRLALHGVRHDSQSDAELEVSLAAAAAATHVEAMLEAADATRQQLQVDVGVDVTDRSLVISLAVPLTASVGSSVSVISATVFGLPVARVAGDALPAMILIERGIRVPLLLADAASWDVSSPCLSASGVVYAPVMGRSELRVFDASGTPLPGINLAGVGISSKMRCSAYADGDAPSLLLANEYTSSQLAAVNPDTRDARWTTSPGSLAFICALTVLPAHGVVVASSSRGGLAAYRLADGIRVGTLGTAGGHSLAADAQTGAIYGGADVDGPSFGAGDGGHAGVQEWEWVTGTGFADKGPVSTAGHAPTLRLVAVMPPASGKSVSHLVVGSVGSGTLIVLALPSLARVHTHALDVDLRGLAADPNGRALAVCDLDSESIHVLAWPLPGMVLH